MVNWEAVVCLSLTLLFVGKLFNFDLLDAEGSEIRCSAFNDAAQTFYERIEVGKVYRISRADIFDIKNPVSVLLCPLFLNVFCRNTECLTRTSKFV